MPAAPGAGQILGFNGSSLVWQSAGSNIFSLNGTSAFYNGGNVGIGTNTPTSKLDVRGDWANEQGALQLLGSKPTLRFTGGADVGNHSWILHLGTDGPGNLGFFRRTGAGLFSYSLVMGSTTGNVGIGQVDPNVLPSKLQVSGQDALAMAGFQPFLTFRDSSAGGAISRIQGVGGSLSLQTENFINGSNPGGLITLAATGNVGIGASPNPIGKLEVVAQDALRLIGFQPFLTLLDSNASYARSRIQGVGGEISLEPESFVNGSDGNAYARVANNGNFSVKTLTIRGGADLAEPFQMSDEIEKGSVVVIDEDQPGRLKRSTSSYDTRVAGIISGANGVNPGISLHQEGVLEGGQNVALSGRVYVRADTTGGPIRAGDLLTTSDEPGRAMRVADPARAQGAVIGKAMSHCLRAMGWCSSLSAFNRQTRQTLTELHEALCTARDSGFRQHVLHRRTGTPGRSRRRCG